MGEREHRARRVAMSMNRRQLLVGGAASGVLWSLGGGLTRATLAQPQSVSPHADLRIEFQWRQDEAAWPGCWGAPITGGVREPFAADKGGEWTAQYFEQGAMAALSYRETAFLPTIARQLFGGYIAVGFARDEPQPPCELPIVGDWPGPGPTYAAFAPDGPAHELLKPAAPQTGELIRARVAADGLVAYGDPIADELALRVGAFDSATRHNVAAVFADYRQRYGDRGALLLGTALAEPFFVTAPYDGAPMPLLVQPFTRRVLVYAVGTDPVTGVFTSELMRHYIAWRYPNGVSETPPIELPTATRTVVEGVAFNASTTRSATIYYEDGLPALHIKAVADAIDFGSQAAPAFTGVGRPANPNVYLFASLDAFRSNLAKYQGWPPANISLGAEAYRVGPPNRRPGIFSGQRAASPASLWRLTLHEYTHHLTGSATQERELPAWFNEGLAEYVPYQLLRDIFQPRINTWFADALTRVVTAERLNKLPSLVELTNGRRWEELTNGDQLDLIYGLAFFAINDLARQHGLRSVMLIPIMVGQGRRWVDAFRLIINKSVEQFQWELRERLVKLAPITLPESGPLGHNFQFVLTGFKPGEAFAIELASPAGKSTWSGSANDAGVVQTSFQTSYQSVPGLWSGRLRGDRGGAAEVSFEVTSG